MPPIADSPIASRPIAAGPSLSATGQPPFAITSTGFFWPGIFPQAARSLSLGMGNSSGILVLGAMGQASTPAGSGSPSFALLASGTQGWQLGPTLPGTPLPMPIAEALEGQPQTLGYSLDAYDGLLPWNGTVPVFSSGSPWVDLALGGSGLYVINPSGIYTSGGIKVSGFSLSSLFSLLASGNFLYALAAGDIYQVTLSSPTSGSISASASLPISATCMGLWAATSGIAIGGYAGYSISPQPFALASVGPYSNSFVSFPGSGDAKAYILSGGPLAWNLLATTTGLAYSSGMALAFTPVGNTILGADAGSGRWDAWSYTGGALALVASGSVSGIAQAIAAESTSTWGLIPQPGASGFYAVMASAATWIGSGTVITGTPLASAVQAISGQTWGVAYSGAIALASVLSGTWTLAPVVTGLAWNPTTLAWDAPARTLWAAGPSGQAWAGKINSTGGLVPFATGTWTSATGTSGIVGSLAIQGQLILVTSGSASFFHTAGILSPGEISSGSSPVQFSGLNPTSFGGPYSDGSLVVGCSGEANFWELAAPYQLMQVPQGFTVGFTTGLASTSGMGYRNVPSAIGVGASGEAWLATTLGYLGALSGAPGTLASSLATGVNAYAPGGYTNSLSISGLTILTTTVQGAILVTSGV